MLSPDSGRVRRHPHSGQLQSCHFSAALAVMCVASAFISGCQRPCVDVVAAYDTALQEGCVLLDWEDVHDIGGRFVKLVEEGQQDHVLYAALLFPRYLNEGTVELYEDFVVELLRTSGDEAFYRVLRQLPYDAQRFPCYSLLCYLWDVDVSDRRAIRRWKGPRDTQFPKTQAYVLRVYPKLTGTMESNVDDSVAGVIKANTTEHGLTDFSVVVVESRTASKYCLVPPLGNNPFRLSCLEDTHVRLFVSVVDLAAAIRQLPPSARVEAGDPGFFQPSRHSLRSLTAKELKEIRTLVEREGQIRK